MELAPGEAQSIGQGRHEGEKTQILDDEQDRCRIDVEEVFEEELEEEHVHEERTE